MDVIESAGEEDVFVVGDIHGCAEEFADLVKRLRLDPSAVLVLIGDYIDRGPAARRVIETLLEYSRRYRVYPLMGNHEASLMEFLEKPESPEAARFLYNGGGATLQSYSQYPGTFSIPTSHLEFIRTLKLAYQSPHYVFVHAGLPNVAIDALDPVKHRRDLLWIRRDFFGSTFNWGKIVVHGHTPVESVQVTDRRINVDTGCVFDNKLSAVHLPSQKVTEVRTFSTMELVYLKDTPESRRKAVRFQGTITVELEGDRANIPFQTINYNEFGILMHPEDPGLKEIFRLGEPIRGKLWTTPNAFFRFVGKVVRIDRAHPEIRYGIQFDSPPDHEELRPLPPEP